jgi:arylsulfatase A-like enzyme
MTRQILVLTIGLMASLPSLTPAQAQAQDAEQPDRPNILFIMVDDLGWTDIGPYGNEAVDTPYLDQLARDGMRFTDAYAAAPVCSPTRAAAMTGQAPARLRITNHIPDRPGFAPDDAPFRAAPARDHLPLEKVTIAERLQAAGYATGFFGKWHLAGASGAKGKGEVKFYPEHQGFDVNKGGTALAGPPSFFDPFQNHKLPPKQTGQYLPDRLADEVIDFIDSDRDDPFFVCLWNYAVHWPMEAPKELVKKYESRTGPGVKDPRYAAMTEALDASLGRIFRYLRKTGLEEDTLVVFTSDNGPLLSVAEPKPLRLGKGYLYEGGIRVPLIVRWPGRVEAGAVNDEPVVTMDFYPTFLDAAGLSPKAAKTLDGTNILPLLHGKRDNLARETLYFHYPNYAFHGNNRLGSAIRHEEFKLIQFFNDDPIELYNLDQDIGETNDLSSERPDQAEALKRDLMQWRKETDAALPEPIDEGE